MVGKNTKYRRRLSRPCDESLGILCDQNIVLTGHTTSVDYPEKLRRIRYKDPKTNKRLVFITNNFDLPAITIAKLYRARWQVELFFKWIKQHLRMKKFYGTSDNAVRTQIWIAVSVYVLVAVIKKKLKLEHSLHTMLQILSLSIFDKTPILRLFGDVDNLDEDSPASNQLNLF